MEITAGIQEDNNLSISTEKRESLQQAWLGKIKDLYTPEEPKLPLLRAVNHDIPLLNKNLKIRHRPSKCPEPLKEKLREKVERYIRASWWKHSNLPSTAPLMIVLKKDGSI